MRKLAGLCMLVCVVGLVSAQTKDKEKDTKKPKDAPRVKATIVKVDAAKMILSVKIDDKPVDVSVGKDVQFIGPRKGVSDAGIKDKRLIPGVILGLVMEGKTLKEVHIPVRTKAKDDKDKGKDKGKDKDKVKDKVKDK